MERRIQFKNGNSYDIQTEKDNSGFLASFYHFEHFSYNSCFSLCVSNRCGDEFGIQRFWFKHVDKGPCVVDVVANVGFQNYCLFGEFFKITDLRRLFSIRRFVKKLLITIGWFFWNLSFACLF